MSKLPGCDIKCCSTALDFACQGWKVHRLDSYCPRAHEAKQSWPTNIDLCHDALGKPLSKIQPRYIDNPLSNTDNQLWRLRL
jgi:hypothetical protein